jgi:ClpP class serine protease
MEQARRSGFVETAEHRMQIEALNFGPERISSVDGTESTIVIKGILTQEPDIMALLYGGGNTTYPEIIGAIAVANDDDNVEDISVFIDSPGGMASGMFQAMDAIRDSKKPVTVIVGGMAASAAYGLTSQGGKILASHRSSSVGAIGTARSFFASDNEFDIASDNAPEKRPDPRTKAGMAAIKKDLNQMAALFDESIAAGRGTTVKKVNANFGKGGMLLAKDAIAQGMIDAMVSGSTLEPAASSTPQEASKMDLITIKAENPALYAEIVALGVTQEKDRVSAIEAAAPAPVVPIDPNDPVAKAVSLEKERVAAHMSSGEACGDMSIATKAIREGTEYGTPAVMAAYNNAAMKKTHIVAANADDADAGNVADGATPPVVATVPTDAEKNKELALKGVEAQMGVSDGDRDFLYTEPKT